MLQQTRASAAIPYYHRFLERFPNVEALAAASEEAVLTAWSGLGYYSRARNLRLAARQVAARGAFPRRYDELRELPGVGDYTAAAIASIAFGEAHAAVDGNVLRVVARMENDAADIASAKTRQRFRAAAEEWLEPKDAGGFNQAMMELGATVCLPRRPLCPDCPLSEHCRARKEGTAAELPVKLRKMVPVAIEAVLLVVKRGSRVLLRQREPNARRMAAFWDLPGPEHLPDAALGANFGSFRHTITNHRFLFTVRAARSRGGALPLHWTETAELSHIPLSTTARKALRLAAIL